MIPDNEAPEGETQAPDEPKTDSPEPEATQAVDPAPAEDASKHVRLGGAESELVKSSAGGDQAPEAVGHTRLGAPEADKEDGA